jgi:DegV family protein with EDD domain
VSSPAPVAVVTDSTSDLPAEQVSLHSITVIPALITVEGQTFEDGPRFARDELYQRMRLLHEPATTAAPSSAAFERAYARLLDDGHERVVSMHASSSLSGIFDIATQAAQAFNQSVLTFDSRQVSLGLGFQVVEAALSAALGHSAEAILDAANRIRDRVRLIAMVNSLESLRRSGRVNWLTANLGDWLSLKVLVEVLDGAVQQLGRVRTRHRAFDELECQATGWSRPLRLAVLHAAVPDEAAAFARRLYPVHPEPWVVEVTTVVGTHVGQGSLGLAALLS